MTKEEKSKQPAILLRLDAEEQIAMLTDKEAGKVFKALFHYVKTGEEMKTRSRVTQMAFTQLRSTIDTYAEAYEAKCARNKAIAKERERKKREAAQAENADSTNVHERTRTYTNVHERVPQDTNVHERTPNINKLNINNNNNNSLTTTHTHTHTHTHEGEDFLADSVNDESFLENCAMALGIPVDRVRSLLAKFGIECKAKSAAHTSMRDFRSHFVDWARIQTSGGRKKQRITTNEDVNELWK